MSCFKVFLNKRILVAWDTLDLPEVSAFIAGHVTYPTSASEIVNPLSAQTTAKLGLLCRIYSRN
jgi:hypothetical protein